MNISNWKLVTSFLFGGGVSGVVEYALGVLNAAIASIGAPNRVKVQAVLNVAMRVLSVLEAVKFLVPTKWQTAYVMTIAAVESVVTALTDLELTADELSVVIDKAKAASDAWLSPDDETCVENV